jgi:hypothetical protein
MRRSLVSATSAKGPTAEVTILESDFRFAYDSRHRLTQTKKAHQRLSLRHCADGDVVPGDPCVAACSPSMRASVTSIISMAPSRFTVPPGTAYGEVHEEWLECLGVVHQLGPAGLPLANHTDGPLLVWSFVALEVRLLEDELATRAERYEPGRARRKDFFHQPCFCFRPYHKNLCQHRDHLWINRPNSDV